MRLTELDPTHLTSPPRGGLVCIGVESNFPVLFQKVTLMETPKPPVSTRPQTTIIGKSIVIKGELSCSEEFM